jgi:hypothetical protein
MNNNPYKTKQQGCKCQLLVWVMYFLPFIFFLSMPAARQRQITLAFSMVSIGDVSLNQATAKVRFDISWDNSWRTDINYDAAWVFIKYSTNAGTSWNHATLKTSGTNPDGFSQGSGTALDIIVPSDKKGAFLRRSVNGVGSISTNSLQFVWDYGLERS